MTGFVENKHIRPEDVGGNNELGLYNALSICKKVKLKKDAIYTIGDEYYGKTVGHFPINADRFIDGKGAIINVVGRKTNGTFFDVINNCTLSVKDLTICYRVSEGGYGQMFRLLSGDLILENIHFDAETPSFSGFIDVEKCNSIAIKNCYSKISTKQYGGFLWLRNAGGDSKVQISKSTIIHDTRDECIAFFANSSQKEKIMGRSFCKIDKCHIVDLNTTHWGCMSYYRQTESGVDLSVELDVINTTFVTLSNDADIKKLTETSSFLYNGSSKPVNLDAQFRNCSFDLGMRTFLHGIGADKNVHIVLDHCKISAFALLKLYSNQEAKIVMNNSRLQLCCLSYGSGSNDCSLHLHRCRASILENNTSVHIEPFYVNVSSLSLEDTRIPENYKNK